MNGKVMVHVAVIEWADDSVDPHLFANRSTDALEDDIRHAIEAAVDEEHAYDEWEHYVLEHINDGRSYQDWYDELHGIGDSPWVTIETKEV